MFIAVQLNPEVTKRQSPWIVVCSYCQHERQVTYEQMWNIKKEKCGSLCRSCAPKNLTGLELGRKNWVFSANRYNDKMRKALSYVNFFSGGYSTEESRKKQREAKLGKFGPLSNRWEDGKTSENKKLRACDAYVQLRKRVFRRDAYTCILCKTKNKKIEMDHIKEWCNYPDFRFDDNNCRTLCVECHAKTDNYKSKAIKKVAQC